MKTIVKQKSRYELQRLENIIHLDLVRFFKETPELEHEFIPDVFAIVHEEVQAIKENFSLSRLAFSNSNDLRCYIQLHHHSLQTLAGHLLNYAAPAHLDHARLQVIPETLAQILYHAIEDLLDFLRTHSHEHLDQDVWLLESYQQIARYRLGNDLPILRTALLHLGVTLDLVAIAMLPLTQFTGATATNQVTHRTVAYLDQLKTRLLRLATSLRENPNRQLVELLCELNFNSPEFVTRCIAYMQYDLRNTLPTADGGPMMLYRFRKLLLQLQPVPGAALHPSLPPLQERLCTWIDAELWYSESIRQPQSTPPTPGTSGIFSKIFTSLTGGELSYFFKVMLKVGIVISDNKTLLGDILATVFQTVNDSDEGDSHRQQLYRVSMRTKKSIASLLTKMLQYVQNDIATSKTLK